MKKLLAMIVATVAAGVILPAFAATVDLSHVTGDTTLNNGDIATGTLEGTNQPYRIFVAAGATVALQDATINGVSGENHRWAGLNCLGDATIILEGTNTVKGFNLRYPGIHIPEERTLSIMGNGSLHASSNGAGSGIGGGNDVSCGNIVINSGNITTIGALYNSGIGAGRFTTCGDITINGGTIVATGGVDDGPSERFGAGIGGGKSCGNITINGGTITATGAENQGTGIGCTGGSTCGAITINGGTIIATGGLFAAGIGGSYDSVCGDITISAGVTSVTATCGGYCDNPIGAGGSKNASCGKVTVLGVTDSVDGKTRTVTGTGEGPAIGWDGNLATLTEDTTIDGTMVVYGQLSTPCKVTIADGATVTLLNASINAGAALADSTPWAGLTCEGDATIVLEGENTVKAFYNRYAGVQFPSGKTLTICGSGSLVAVSGGMAAGIGAGYSTGSACGDIVIDGGVIIASGGSYGAGIGTGWGSGSDCGNITIRGGDVTAQGGQYAAGIGSSYSRTCGDITIAKGIARVVATCGANCENPIGAGSGGTSGTVTVATGLSDDRGSPTRTIEVSASGYPAWAADNGIAGAWNDKDAYGIYNVFRYAFDEPVGDFTLIGITFDEAGKAVVVTPPLVNGEGFALSVVASDNVTGTGNVAETPLSVSGETTINETGKAKRFFRLKATEAE